MTMQNKFYLLLILLGLFTMGYTFSQENTRPPQNNENKKQYHYRLVAMKMAFIVEKSGLSSEEEAVFWPIYKTYQDTINSLIVTMRRSYNPQRYVQADEAALVLQQLMYNERKIFEERQRVYRQLINQLSPQKIIHIINAEKMFDKQMIKKYRENNRNRGSRGNKSNYKYRFFHYRY